MEKYQHSPIFIVYYFLYLQSNNDNGQAMNNPIKYTT